MAADELAGVRVPKLLRDTCWSVAVRADIDWLEAANGLVGASARRVQACAGTARLNRPAVDLGQTPVRVEFGDEESERGCLFMSQAGQAQASEL